MVFAVKTNVPCERCNNFSPIRVISVVDNSLTELALSFSNIKTTPAVHNIYSMMPCVEQFEKVRDLCQKPLCKHIPCPSHTHGHHEQLPQRYLSIVEQEFLLGT